MTAQRDKLLTPAEVAEWLLHSTDTLAQWRVQTRKGKPTGPKHQPVGSRVFYRESDVQAYLDEQREAAS